jgi:hypothetical protein
MIDTQGKFYLGRIVDPKDGKTSDQPLLYDPDDLTTHAVVVGMTGSGKTGLCIDLLEEAALLGIPALMIDPKGDITNTLLHFPNLAPKDFKPWVNPDVARKEGKTLEVAGEEAAASWQKGLADWGIGAERIQALQKAAEFAIYTPGSDAGIPVSILASLKAPEIPWESNREVLREKISSTVTALLGLVGVEVSDPISSREHILLSNIFENAWSQAKDLDLGELILQTQNPPFPKLGVFDVDTFFPQKERFTLSMQLNNILAAPAFQTWIEGQALDIPSLLHSADGRPRHSVFYIAHLNDAERMFFITLLYSIVESWMRAQPGTSSLRAIIYFDEIFGYLPPVANPPSKEPMLRMLKQGRAFGVGQVLVTQNPVDVDYKGLSNAGSWFIGKLQTDQDKQRLLDGLEGATSGGLDRAAYDRMISALGKRVFLLHNVHEKKPQIFQTRWAMNYLTGPLTRTQIPALNQLVGASVTLAPPQASTPPPLDEVQPIRVAPAAGRAAGAQAVGTTTTRPVLPAGVREYFLPHNLTLAEAFKSAGRSTPAKIERQALVYQPVLLAQADVRFLERKYNLDHDLKKVAIVANPDRRGAVRWEDYPATPVDQARLDRTPEGQALFTTPEAPLTDSKILSAMEKDFEEWVYRSAQVSVKANQDLKLYAGPEVSSADFRTRCAEEARKGRDAEGKKAANAFDRKIDSLQTKLDRETRELAQDQTELSQRKMEELGTAAENILGLFGGRKSSRRLSSSLSKRRMTSQAKADVDESVDAITDYKKQIAELEKEKAQALEELNQHWGELANQVSEIPVTPMKKDILVELFGVAWMPVYQVDASGEAFELPGYAAE